MSEETDKFNKVTVTTKFKKVTVTTVVDYYIPDYMTCGFPTLDAMCNNWFKEFPATISHAARDGCDRIFKSADYKIEVSPEEEHQQIHKDLHKNMDLLVADWISHTGGSITNNSVWDLMKWASEQAENPTEKEG